MPSMRRMIQNGLPNHAASSSSHSISGTGTSVCCESASITRYCVSKFASRNTVCAWGAMRATRWCTSGVPVSSSQVASKRMVSLENPVPPGISRWSTTTLRRPATSPSQRCNWATVVPGSRDVNPMGRNLTQADWARRPLVR